MKEDVTQRKQDNSTLKFFDFLKNCRKFKYQNQNPLKINHNQYINPWNITQIKTDDAQAQNQQGLF